MEQEKEIFYFGQIITEPQLTWTDFKIVNNEIVGNSGWSCWIQTNSNLLDGTEIKLWSEIQYDLNKWKDKPVRSGSMVKLSLKQIKSSNISPDGKRYCFNIVIRK
jgi:hypothetical protein